MIAVYHWINGNYELFVINVADNTTETFLKTCEYQNYPIPDDGTEVVWIENNQLIDQRFI